MAGANNLGVNSYTEGGDYDVWGAKFIADMAILNKMAGDVATFSDVTAGSDVVVTLTTSQMQNFSLRCTGSGSDAVNLRVVDALCRFWWAQNDRATGNMNVRCAAGGASVTLTPGQRRLVYSDGTDIVDLTLLTLAISSVSGLTAALAAKQDSITPATAAQIWANVADKFLQTDESWASAVPVNLGNLTGAVTLDLSTFVNGYATLTGNVTVTFSNPKAGQSGMLELTHGTSARTWTQGSNMKSAGGSGITLSTVGGGTVDGIGYYIDHNLKMWVWLAIPAVA